MKNYLLAYSPDSIKDIEEAVDRGELAEFSVFNEMKKINASQQIATKITDYYTPIRDEITELLTKKNEDLTHAYRQYSLVEKKAMLVMFNTIIDDASKFIQSKKATRAPRKPKKIVQKPASVLTKSVKYKKEDTEYKISSVSPETIVGSNEVYMFNTKTRKIFHIAVETGKTLSIKGTTIINIDEALSTCKTVRKPEIFLQELLQGGTKARILKQFKALTTTEGAGSGRLNEDMIILKVIK